MSNLLNKLMSGARQYSVFDFGMLKMSLLLIGILVGIYGFCFFMQYSWSVWVVWVLAVVCTGYIIISTLSKAFCKKREKESGKM